MSNPADANDEASDPFEDVPENMQALIEHIGIPEFDDLEKDEKDVYEVLKHGRCMACHGPLQDTTVFVVTRQGIVGGYCSGQCITDFAVLGFLQEAHEDVMSALKFRGEIDADAPEEKDE